jgi:protein-tyrosine phosphatase
MRTELYWIEGPWADRLAIAARPRGGDWLEDEVRSWRQAGVDVIVSLLTSDEIAEFDLAEEAQAARKHGIEFKPFPIADRGVPASRKSFLTLAHTLVEQLAAGKRVAIHCRQGIGRSSLLAACLLVLVGEDPERAFRGIRLSRGCAVPDTFEQEEWVKAFAADKEAVTLKDKH